MPKKSPANVFAFGEILVKYKEEAVRRCVDEAKGEGSSVATAERKAASLFYRFAAVKWGVSKPTTARYVQVYERFADSRHRAEMEEHFSASELVVLAAYSDDELTEVVRDTAMNPSLTREQLKQLLKARQAA
ncbi:hypothetical protein [Caballeronia sp. LZ043]|uniref:hypothetical protein n=1 Tax=Caballeronia sp. LZ043 TaxID=3038569 RepID=UPI0028644DC3|nr:hypothetical protein [Caballeronia sp. LZ043]MDR5826131.1 hypothetical protein [Caballeronia sp. LZ043]